MKKYVKIVDNLKKTCIVGMGKDFEYYKRQGYIQKEVEQSDLDGNWYLKGYAPTKPQEQKVREEIQRIAQLNLTAADVERAIYRAKGMDFDDVVALVENSRTSEIDVKALKIELKANNFYRGNPYIDAVGTLLGFTKTQLDEFFETNDYTKLLTESEVKNG